MELWFSEKHTENVKLSLKIDKQLYSADSGFQRIDIFETVDFGRCLTLDGFLMLTERDEFVYHEMITHVPMAVHPDPKKILVVGAGDGGAVRELVKYSDIKKIDMVEIDKAVVDAAKEYLPFTAAGFSDERVTVYYEDGLKFIRRVEDEYDIIIVDSTDPFGNGEVLFTKEFYGSCYKALKDDGIMVNQHESAFYQNDAAAMQKAHKLITQCFGISRLYQAHIPTYPSGNWLFGFSSKKYHPIRDIKAREWNARGIVTKYYNTNLHKGAFALPNYVEEILKNVEKY
ncbi:MAG: polyamine aminopropyltransferase [Clostridiales bacterium]|nr:polyamine aminopropyltransferase [Clostridiales bacterium]